MQTKIKLMTIAASVLLALALQVSELSAFGSPVEQPAPPRPTPPVHVQREGKSDKHQSKSGRVEVAPLLQVSADGVKLLWVWVVGK